MSVSGFTADEMYGRMSPARRRALDRARRHTKFVRFLRLALPFSSIALVVMLGALIFVDPRTILAEVDAESLGISGSKIVMQNPNLSGHSAGEDGTPRAYRVTAARAEQNLQKPNEIDLFTLAARIEMREGGWARLSADTGQMDTRAQTLALSDNIQIHTDLGDRAGMSKAFADMAKGEITSDEPVALMFARGDLEADSMQLFRNGERAVFTGRVRMNLKPDTAAPLSPPPSGAAQ